MRSVAHITQPKAEMNIRIDQPFYFNGLPCGKVLGILSNFQLPNLALCIDF